jgi:hypothetical protein
MRTAFAVALTLLLVACGGGAKEVLRQRSPDGKVDAVVLETVRGDMADYEIRAEPVDPANGTGGTLLTIVGVQRGVICPRPFAISWMIENGYQAVNATAQAGRIDLAAAPLQFRSGTVLARIGGPMPAETHRCPDAPAPKEGN